MSFIFPDPVLTDRLIIRPWNITDAQRMKETIDANLEHLQPWMPWAMNEPSPIEEIEGRIEMFAEAFTSGADATYAIFARDGTVLGGTGLHPREYGLEIGYWISAEHVNQGYATEAAAALTLVAFRDLGVEEVNIRCDPQNTPSAAIPKRLGYRHVKTIAGETSTPGGLPRDTMIWRMTRERFIAGGLMRAG